ncbi:MAG TPA: RHS repeat-associated core domain-containing protein [Terriglobales bacterium]|nr:RHS repeat-associated core domain-containing protein [Terriglobales bacterium]
MTHFGACSFSAALLNYYKFTGKERDAESGLDNFGARYNASSLGRFMTPDWAARPIAVPYAVFGDPQSLNLYGYVRNDPVSQADADGHCNTGTWPAACPGDFPDEPGGFPVPHYIGGNPQAQNKSWFKKALGYFYFKVGKGVSVRRRPSGQPPK